MGSPRRRPFLVLGLSLLVLAAGAACGRAAAPAKGFSFRLPKLGGGTVRSADFHGKVVIIDFWASWCGPCVFQARILHKLQEQYPQKDVQFLAVNVGEDEKTVRKYVAEHPFHYPVLLDEDTELSSSNSIFGLPTLVILDRTGAVSFRNTGIVPEKELHALLRKAGAPEGSAAPSKPAAAKPAAAKPAAAKPPAKAAPAPGR